MKPSLPFGSSLPRLAPIREGEERLIDQGWLTACASASGLAERYARGVTPHTIHVWWARRPLSAMRALVFAASARDPSPEDGLLLRELASSPIPSPEVLERVRHRLERDGHEPPHVLDMFGGGGTIGLEAARLGLSADAIEINELAVFLERNLLVRARAVEPERLALLLRESGTRVLERLAEATEPFFPLRHHKQGADTKARVTTYLWTYSTACDGCGYRFFLSRRPWLSRRKGRRVMLRPERGERGQRLVLVTDPEERPAENVWIGRTGKVRCPECGCEGSAALGTCRDELAAFVVGRNGGGKAFVLTPPEALPSPEALAEAERHLLDELGWEFPSSRMPRWSGIANPALYGLDRHSELLNPRQRLVMVGLIRELLDEHRRLELVQGQEVARGVIGLLSGLIDQLVDWNGRLSMWIAQNEQVGRGFCGPGLAMLWDYAEIDPASRGPANLWSKLERIIKGASALADLPGPVRVTQGSARCLPFDAERFDAIVTDPPYYDNIFYSLLADAFFAWKRPVIRHLEPDLAKSAVTAEAGELVASTHRYGDPVAAHERYCEQLIEALGEASRVLRKDGVMALVYSHSSLGGWEALTRAIRSVPLVVTSVQPLRIERRQRPRAMGSTAINTCLVFVMRPSLSQKPRPGLDELTHEVEAIRDGPFPRELRDAGWDEADIALAVFAQAVGLLANSEIRERGSGIRGALEAMVEVVRCRFGGFEISGRRSL